LAKAKDEGGEVREKERSSRNNSFPKKSKRTIVGMAVEEKLNLTGREKNRGRKIQGQGCIIKCSWRNGTQDCMGRQGDSPRCLE